LRKDGSELWALLAAAPLLEADGSYAGALAMVTDISERRREMAALRVAEARCRSLFEQSPHCLWEEDLSDAKLRLDELRASGVTDIRSYLEQHQEAVQNCVSKFKILNVNQAALRHYEVATKARFCFLRRRERLHRSECCRAICARPVRARKIHQRDPASSVS
jgi:PAS domain-containing protein